ncbi:unnamed protein product [Tilletia controversa]|uniref:Uncharacterized protein n=1 Tax=Tilletia controversa TaxID=13291 RepID=A0A8X7T059_9BASI|nr:hypothetical protein CF328_g740 [Tilletia controversa]KAE8254558.1 hypothetical protein A4X06_0g851 [Tilletia controversa]CAD6909869.1 unnamed protein product [Tilletia controversa]CAD6936120.1 unnamed protein product [Tilletia controversa]CAD6937754.1 unnamed protein product [Tilletia controversa]
MDLSHLRDELANPQMDGPPGQRATHPALSAQFKQTAIHLTSFWRSSLRASENAYHRGYLAALGDVRDMLSRLDNIQDGQGHGQSQSQERLLAYLTARMEAVAEDVKGTATLDSDQPGPSSASSSQTASNPPASPTRPSGFRLSTENSNSSTTGTSRPVSAFASSTSAFASSAQSARPLGGSGIALGSEPSSSSSSAFHQNQDGSNTAARMARLRFGLPRLRDQSVGVESESSPKQAQDGTQAGRSRPMDTDQQHPSSSASSSPMANAQSTSQATTPRPGPNSLVERVALAKVARANMLSASSSSDRSNTGAAASSSTAPAPAPTHSNSAASHHVDSCAPTPQPEPTPPSTPISPLRQLHPAAAAQAQSPSLERGSSNAFTFASPSRFFSIPSAFGASPAGDTTTTGSGGTSGGLIFSPSSKTSSTRTPTKYSSTRPRPPIANNAVSSDDEDDRSDNAGGGESDAEPLRMPMIRRRPPTRSSADSDGGKDAFLAGMGGTVGRPRKRRK